MSTHTFHTLSPQDFEELVGDLLQRELGVQLSTFPPGRDGGIDLCSADRRVVVQCKHYLNSTFEQLMRELRNEVPKVRKLAPERYLVATSQPLTAKRRADIRALFHPYCRSDGDVYDREALNQSLRNHGGVEQNHFKLWLTSVPVLERVLHNAAFVRAAAQRARIERAFPRLVRTSALDAARQHLSSRRICLITGDPGIGKTTLADVLIGELLGRDDGWELVIARRDAAEGLNAWRSAGKQIFYLDDLLGDIGYDERLKRNEALDLLELISLVRHTPDKLLILTTRTYVLQQATESSERLGRADLAPDQFRLAPSGLSASDRASILSNHLYFSSVPAAHVRAVVEGPLCGRILGHPNYSPRVVERLADPAEVSGRSPEDYPSAILQMLDNPAELWSYVFRRDVSPAARHLLLALAPCRAGVFVRDLRTAFDRLHGQRAREFNIVGDAGDFEAALKETDGTFVALEPGDGGVVATLPNTSFLDYLAHRLRDDERDFVDLVRAATSFDQLAGAVGLVVSGPPATAPDAGKRLGAAAGALATAFEQTIGSPAVRVSWTYERRGRRASAASAADPAERLAWGAKLASRLGAGVFRDTVRRAGEAFFLELDADDEARPRQDVLTQILDAVGPEGWGEPDLQGRWIGLAILHLVRRPDDMEEATALARWARKNRAALAADWADLSGDLDTFLSDALDELCSEWTLAEFDPRGLEVIELIEAMEPLGFYLDREMDRIRERRHELEEAEAEDERQGRRRTYAWSSSPTPSATPADDPKDALRQLLDSLPPDTAP